MTKMCLFSRGFRSGETKQGCKQQNLPLGTTDPQAPDRLRSWGGELRLFLSSGGPRSTPVPSPRAGTSRSHVSLSLNTIRVDSAQPGALRTQQPLPLLCFHMQVFPPFRLIPRKVTLIIGAMMQVGAKGCMLAHTQPVAPAWLQARAPPPPWVSGG